VSDEERFREKIQLSDRDGCWLWVGLRNRHGYGLFWADGRKVYAHQWAYECAHGLVPDGYELAHVAGGSAGCVNPDHFRLVDPKKSRRRSFRLVRAARVNGRIAGLSCRKHDLPEGVSPNGKGFQARIRQNGRIRHLGTFSTVREAAQAHQTAREERRL